MTIKNLQSGIYKHYKGNFYQVLDIVTHSETMEVLVLYKQLYDKELLWVRPLSMFLEKIEIDGEFIERFEFIKTND
ncbi:MAG: DUF1653 domain-containing protein [Bacteroidota bacterium]|nr:DUF1653 domain-containing protein [Bacteroidota bacterium]